MRQTAAKTTHATFFFLLLRAAYKSDVHSSTKELQHDGNDRIYSLPVTSYAPSINNLSGFTTTWMPISNTNVE